ncbi:MAG: peptidylprolyl isomerase [Pseudonocardiales bacterium]|nr:peptidylprolyl isomerase [Pseudonocardiales bacterium]
MRRSLVVAVAAALCTLAGCGSSTPPAATPPPAAPSAAVSPVPAPSPVAGVPALSGNPTDITKQSQAQAGAGQPPTKLVTQDIVVGKGAAATLANTVDVRYTGTLYTDGTLFDSSWSRGDAPTSFPLSGVVPGFAQGIAGMQPGGRRVIVIPPALGYGDQATGPIPAGSTLVFVVDLVGAT